MSEQAELNPCICGKQARIYCNDYGLPDVERYSVGCDDWTCPWSAGEYDSEAEAIAAWNKRAGEVDNRRLRELERACDTLWCERRQDGTRCMASPTEHGYSKEETQQLDAAINAIGRLLEGEG